MKERPIIMSAESVQAILDGRKTQTRRIVKPQPTLDTSCLLGTVTETTGNKKNVGKCFWCDKDAKNIENEIFKNPYGQTGDRLWVKQRYCNKCETPCLIGMEFIDCMDCEAKSPLFMKKEYAEIWLEITNIRVERLQDITEADAIAEGFISNKKLSEIAKLNFELTWDKLNAKRGYSWDSNPFVWVIEFRRVE